MNQRFSVLTVVKKSVSDNMPFSVTGLGVTGGSTVPAKLHSPQQIIILSRKEKWM